MIAIIRRGIVAATMLAAASVCAQNYPVKPILMIVPLQAGSAGDVMMRIVAQKMADNMGQQIVIENQAGAAGLIGAERLSRANADGYTIGGVSDSVLNFAPNLYKQVNFDPVASFQPVSMVATIAWVMIAHPSLPAKSVRELVALAKAQPGKLDFPSGGNGSPQHIAMELFQSATATRLTHVPYRGATQAALDVLSGHMPVMFTALSIVLQNIKEGKVRALAVTNAKRSTLLPDVPTMSEAGVPGFVFNTWAGIYAPARTPLAIVEKLNAETLKALKDATVRERLLGLGMEATGSTPEELRTMTRNGLAKMSKVIRQAGIQAQ